jgi:hypothetical protein
LLEHPGQINVDNQKSIRCEAIRNFRNKTRQHLKDKVNELAMNYKNKKIRDRREEYIDLEGATKTEVIH